MNRLTKLRIVFGLSRCEYCNHFIWYNHRFGWHVWDDGGGATLWHTTCRRERWLALEPIPLYTPEPLYSEDERQSAYKAGWDDAVAVISQRSPTADEGLDGFIHRLRHAGPSEGVSAARMNGLIATAGDL